jgi:hypothetical protein
MTLMLEVVRQGRKDLHAAGQGVTELDLWLAAGMVNTLDITYMATAKSRASVDLTVQWRQSPDPRPWSGGFRAPVCLEASGQVAA